MARHRRLFGRLQHAFERLLGWIAGFPAGFLASGMFWAAGTAKSGSGKHGIEAEWGRAALRRLGPLFLPAPFSSICLVTFHLKIYLHVKAKLAFKIHR